MTALPPLPAYCLLLITKYGGPHRRVFLDLNHATEAAHRAEAKGQPARLVLCRIEPVTNGLDLDGGEMS